MDTTTPLLVLKLVPQIFHHGTLGIVRSLGRLGVTVYAVHDTPRAPAARSRYGEVLGWNAPQSGPRALEELLRLGRQIGGRPILIPTDDLAVALVDDHSDVLRDQFLFPDQPPGLVTTLSSKREMHFLCARMGVPTPDVVFPRSRDDVADYARSGAFPVVLKAIESFLPGHEGSVLEVVHSREQLLARFDELEPWERDNVMLQEYVPGGPESVWMFNGYFDSSSDCLFGLTGRKLRQFPPYTGLTCLGVCAPNDWVEETTIGLMRSLGYRGIIDIGYRFDARDGRYKLLDVNPRIGATFRLFVGRGGMDVARASYLDLTGQPVPADEQPNGRKWIIETWDPLSSARYIVDRRLSVRRWLRSFAGIEEGAWLARDDWRPAAAASLELARTTARYGRRKLRARLARS
jgi:D-aspartate ligase